MPISKIKSSAIDANAITGAGIADGTVDTADLAAGAVTSAKLDTNIDIAGTLDVTGTLTADSNIAAGSTVTAVGGMTSSATSGGNTILATNSGTTGSDTSVFQGNAGSYYNQMFLYGSGESYFQTNGTSLTFGTISNSPVYIKSNNGNVLRIDSDGLKFGSDTAAANALDDYEEGTWTPTFDGLTNTPTFHNHNGKYTKIGNLVILQYFCQVNTTTNPTFSNNNAVLYISGVPFAASGSGYTGSQGSVNAQSWSWNGTNNNQNVTGQVSASVSGSKLFFNVSPSGGNRGDVTNVSVTSSGPIIEATVMYRTA